jgi:hypothetical protein
MVEGRPKQVYIPKWKKLHGGGKKKGAIYAQTEHQPWWREAIVHKICPVREKLSQKQSLIARKKVAPPETEPNNKKGSPSRNLIKKGHIYQRNN